MLTKIQLPYVSSRGHLWRRFVLRGCPRGFRGCSRRRRRGRHMRQNSKRAIHSKQCTLLHACELVPARHLYSRRRRSRFACHGARHVFYRYRHRTDALLLHFQIPCVAKHCIQTSFSSTPLALATPPLFSCNKTHIDDGKRIRAYSRQLQVPTTTVVSQASALRR